MTLPPGPDTGGDNKTLEAVSALLGESLYVEAGAGTGKTHALVTRLTELLASGKAEPRHVAAITFTRAAAFEMRSRVRSALEERKRKATEPEMCGRLEAVIEGLDSAAIQTIHSFALSMLEELPLDAGMPPLVTPMDEIEAGIRFDERWRAWLEARLKSDEVFTKALATAHRLHLSKPLDRLRYLAEKLSDRREMLQPGMFAPAAAEVPAISASRLREAVDEIMRLRDYCAVTEDNLYRHVTESVGPSVEAVLAATGSAGAIATVDLADIPKIAATSTRETGSKKNWQRTPGGGEAQELLKDLLRGLQEEVSAALAALCARTTAELLTATVDFVIEYSEERKREGRPTYHDQLVWARDLLRDSPKANEHFRKRYRFILVDEFQDTDPLQIEILRLLASSGDGSITPGSLFLVGDPKQSIYRFRGADPAEAKLLSSVVAGASKRLTLRENRRSVKCVLDWVNCVFGPWMAEGAGDGQAVYEDLAPAQEVAASEGDGLPPAVRWFGGEAQDSPAAVRVLEFTEAADIARAAGEGALRVRDRDGSWRQSTFGDVAVLLKTRNGIDFLEEALTAAGVPFVFEGQSPLFTSQDVRDLHNCLTAIDDPADLVAVLAALRTPAFSCSDVDLWRWKDAGRSFFYLDEPPADAPGPVAAAFRALHRYHTLSRSIPVARLVEQFVREMRMREKAALSRKGPERLRRINMIVELAAVMSVDEPVTLRDFAGWLEQQSEENARMPEPVSEAASTDAVRVMTIHGAKGLEFPVVIMASAGDGSPNTDPAQAQQWRDAGGPARLEAQLGAMGLNMRTPGFEAAHEQDKAQTSLENVRLLYVAATRARDHLFVSRWRSVKGGGSLAARIDELMQDRTDLWEPWRHVPPRPPEAQVNGAAASTREGRARWLAGRAALVALSSASGYVTATGLKPPYVPVTPLPKDESDAAESEPGRSGRGSAELGRAVHAVLQNADLAAGRGQDLAGLARRMADEHGIPGEAAQVEALAQRVLGTGIMRRAGDAARRGRAWRETGVAAPLAGQVGGDLEGQIDLIFEEADGGLTIVDYKTDRVEGRTVEEAAAPYLPQMGAYAWAVECATGRSVTSAVLIFARLAATEATAEYPVPDLQHWKQEAARLAGEQLSPAPVDG